MSQIMTHATNGYRISAVVVDGLLPSILIGEYVVTSIAPMMGEQPLNTVDVQIIVT